jgi:SAM-dependent methyltransferase
MARISYDDQTAAAYKAVREVPRDGLGAWREAVRRHLRPSPGMTVVDIGAGTGAFAAAFSDWFDLAIVAVEPSAAMRAQIPAARASGYSTGMPAPSRCQTTRRTAHGCRWSSTTSPTSKLPHARSAASCALAPPC